jgi:uncharacterized protein YndB with AHSA1/START domain
MNTLSPIQCADGAALEIRRLFDAPRELVFSLWSNLEHVKRWWHPSGFSTPAFEMDFREGGRYRYCIRKGATDSWAEGVYREIRAPERLVFTFRWDSGDRAHDADTLITVTFEAQGEQTLMTLRQERFASIERRDGHAIGWGQVLDSLADFIATQTRQM